jgi:hypothetical protein
MTTWHAGEDGMNVYRDGKLVAVIPTAEYVALIYALARELRALSE